MRSGGVRFTSPVIFDRGDTRNQDIAEILRQQLKKVGIEIVLQPLEKATMAQRVWINSDFDLWTGNSSQGNDPCIGIERMFVKAGQRPVPSNHNTNEYYNPEVEKLFLLARTTLDQKKRGQYYREVQLILSQDLPTLPLTDNHKFAAFSKKVKGVNEQLFLSYYYAPSDAWFSP
jgi:peptide/nickel transport system substrate-binding protein